MPSVIARRGRRDVGCAGLRRHFCPDRHAAPSLKIQLALELPHWDRYAAENRVFFHNPATVVGETNIVDEPAIPAQTGLPKTKSAANIAATG